MDRQFMKDYYEGMYEDSVQEIMTDSEEREEYEQLRKELGIRDSEMCAFLQGEGREAYELLSDAANQLLSCVARTMYLRGAEDREKMLR